MPHWNKLRQDFRPYPRWQPPQYRYRTHDSRGPPRTVQGPALLSTGVNRGKQVQFFYNCIGFVTVVVPLDGVVQKAVPPLLQLCLLHAYHYLQQVVRFMFYMVSSQSGVVICVLNARLYRSWNDSQCFSIGWETRIRNPFSYIGRVAGLHTN